jgi:hypothetical protein
MSSKAPKNFRMNHNRAARKIKSAKPKTGNVAQLSDFRQKQAPIVVGLAQKLCFTFCGDLCDCESGKADGAEVLLRGCGPS